VDENRAFYPEPLVDRTPYQACFSVSIITLAVFCLGFWGLWQAGSFLRRHHLTFGNFHTATLPVLPANPFDTAKQAASDAATKQADQLKAAAAAEAQKQAAKLIDQQEKAAEDQLKEMTSPTPSPTK